MAVFLKAQHYYVYPERPGHAASITFHQALTIFVIVGINA